tara:strand:- start:651 stop:1490 length:840 start_codon:yes stop_codon:yes gene_type:complete
MSLSSLSLAKVSSFFITPKRSPQLTGADYHNVSGTSSGNKTSITDTNLTIPALPIGGANKRHFIVFVTYRHLSGKLTGTTSQNNFYGMGGNPIAPISGGNISCTVNGVSTSFELAAGSAFNGSAVFKGKSDLAGGTASIVYSFPSSGGGNYAVALYVLDYVNDIQFETTFRRFTGGISASNFGLSTIAESDISQVGTTHNFRAAHATSSNSSSLFIATEPFSSEPSYTNGLSNVDNGTNERNASFHSFSTASTEDMVTGVAGANASGGYSILQFFAKIR